jgi:hypothetical protein
MSTKLFTTKKTNRDPKEKDTNIENSNNTKNKVKKTSEEDKIYSQKTDNKMDVENDKKNEMKIELPDNTDPQKQDNPEGKKDIISSPNKSEDDKIKSLDENTENSKNSKSTKKKKGEDKGYAHRMLTRKKDRDKILQDGYQKFLQSKQKYEWDLFLLNLILKVESNLQNFKDFNDDFTYYIYNNLRGLRTSKEFANLKSQPVDQILYKESIEFCEERFKRFIQQAGMYKIKLLDNYIKKHKMIQNNNINNNNTNNSNNSNTSNNTNNASNNNTSNTNNNTSNNTSNTPNKPNTPNAPNTPNNQNPMNNPNIDYQIEMLTAALVYNSLNRNEKEQEKFDKDNKKDKNDAKAIIPIKIEVLNFNLNEDSMMAVISGIKFNNNITEVNVSGNLLGPQSLFWLGGIFKTNPNLAILDLTRCGIDNDCLFMFVQGTKFSNESLNKDQLNLSRLNLKDNNQISDIINEQFEHPLGLLLRRFKLKWLNLTNAKIKNKGTCNFLNTFKALMKENKIYMENLILISNEFYNEKCLEILGDIIVETNCPLKNVILSKNLITTPPSMPYQNNYYDYFMKKVTQSNLKELFLISCGIGRNANDIKILYDMLCENKSLISLRLFGNEIKNMEDFSNILGIFSEYKNGLKNTTLKSLDLSKNSCNIKINDDFLELVEKLKLEYLDINQNTMDPTEKETFRSRTNELNDIKIIY